MIPFLKAVARAYSQRYDNLSNFCFVFPNKRSGTFFLKYLRSSKKQGGIAPEITTITDFVANVGQCIVDNRISSLFTLYKCYCDLLSPDKRPDFDSFRTWGETVLSDFNEVGMNCSEPQALFKNLKDHREISTDFLTEEQRRIMEEYFGVSAYKNEEETFWNHFNNKSHRNPEEVEDKEGEGYLPTVDNEQNNESDDSANDRTDNSKKIPLRKRFLKLWETLWPLYQSFHEALAKKGLVSSSGAYRSALKNIREFGRESISRDKIVFVGFNALTHVELDLFFELQKLGSMGNGSHPEDSFTDFIWDATGPIFNALNKREISYRNSATRFVSANMRRFPQPKWAGSYLEKAETNSLPTKLKAIASPSNVMQAKLAAKEVGELAQRFSKRDFSEAKMVVVLPDENILVPFLYALPQDITDVNLTMGFPMRHTSIFTFISRLRLTLRSSRVKKGDLLFYYSDLKLLLAHPVTRLLGGEEAVSRYISQTDMFHKVFVSLSDLVKQIPGLAPLMNIPDVDGSPVLVVAYIEEVLRVISDSLVYSNNGILKSGVDSEYIEDFRSGLRPLKRSIEEYDIPMSRDTVLAIIQRVVGNMRINFEGEPLKGLQIMGLLETRLLDFDIVVIPSLNERILPMKARSRSFIPNALRVAYGLPPANYSENLFAYYFYRLISRAREVVMLYDARSGSGMRSGGPSRYIHQLEHLFAPELLEQTEATFKLSELTPTIEPIEKTPEIFAKLNEYLEESDSKNRSQGIVMSATALNDYCKCEKFFFFKYLAKIPDVKQTTIHVDSVRLGNIVHRVMEQIYSDSGHNKWPFTVDVTFIDNLLSETNPRLTALATEAMIREFEFLKQRVGNFPPDYEIVRDSVIRMVRGILLNDRGLALKSETGTFKVLGCETSGLTTVETSKERKIRFRYAIDRTDVIDGNLRIVDYKTGTIHATGRDFQEMFNENSTSMTNFLQLMTYAGFARQIWPEEAEGGVGMVLYKVTEMSRESLSRSSTPMVKPKMEDKDPETDLKVERTFESDECVVCKTTVAPRKIETTIEEGPAYRDQFQKMLKDKLDSIFDSPTFNPTENSKVCDYCPYSTFCLR